MTGALTTRLSISSIDKIGCGKLFRWEDYKTWYLTKLSDEQKIRFDRLVSAHPALIQDSNLSSAFSFSIISDYFKSKDDRDIYQCMQDEVVRLFAQWFSVDKDIFLKDKFYATWFFFAENNIAKIINRYSDCQYVQIRAIEDNLSPKDCLSLNGRLFKVESQSFADVFNAHWITPRYGCRCSVSVFGESLASRKINEGMQLVPDNSLKTISADSVSYSDVVFGLIDKPYDFGHSYCQLVELLPRDNNYYEKIEQLRLIEIFRESIDIVIATKSVETAQSRMDVARSMLSQFDWQFIADEKALTQIKGRVNELFMDAHTATYVNIYEAHLKRASEVKRQTTKDKYTQLAIDCLETALKDEYTHKDEIQKLMLDFRLKVN